MDRKHRIFKGKHINVIGNDYTRSVIEMVLEHYDTAERDNTLFVIWPPYGFHDREIHYKNFGEHMFVDLEDMKQTYDYVIFYDLEHTANHKFQWINDDWLEPVDEIWTPWIENLGCYGEANNDKATFMPLRACKFLMDKHIGTCDNPFYGGAFFGYMTEYRRVAMSNLLQNPMASSDVDGYYIVGVNQYEIPEAMSNTKFLLDFTQHWRQELWTQNVVRDFEGICLGKTVISDKSSFNYFPDMVIELDDPFSELIPTIKTTEPKDYSCDYKNLTYTDKAFESYRLDCIERYNAQNISLPVKNNFYNRYKRLINQSINSID